MSRGLPLAQQGSVQQAAGNKSNSTSQQHGPQQGHNRSANRMVNPEYPEFLLVIISISWIYNYSYPIFQPFVTRMKQPWHWHNAMAPDIEIPRINSREATAIAHCSALPFCRTFCYFWLWQYLHCFVVFHLQMVVLYHDHFFGLIFQHFFHYLVGLCLQIVVRAHWCALGMFRVSFSTTVSIWCEGSFTFSFRDLTSQRGISCRISLELVGWDLRI